MLALSSQNSEKVTFILFPLCALQQPKVQNQHLFIARANESVLGASNLASSNPQLPPLLVAKELQF